MREKLAELHVLAANGILLLEDPDRDPSDPIDIGEAAVTATHDTIIFGVQHDVDGLVEVAVFTGDEPGELPVAYFDGEISNKYGRLILRDVPDENRITLPVDAGPIRVRIFADIERFAERVEILLPGIE